MPEDETIEIEARVKLIDDKAVTCEIVSIDGQKPEEVSDEKLDRLEKMIANIEDIKKIEKE